MYKIVMVGPKRVAFKEKSGYLFEKAKKVIESEAQAQWRLIQVWTPNYFGKGASIFGFELPVWHFFFPGNYQLIFEKDEQEQRNYEYKFVKVEAGPHEPYGRDYGVHSTMRRVVRVKEIIQSHTSSEWRLKQVVAPFNEKTGLYSTLDYQIIFEKQTTKLE